MTADKQLHLVPKLRFAEFVHEPPWDCPPLRKLAQRITRRNTRGADLRTLTNSAEHGVIDQREYFDRDIATNTDNYFIVETGDYVYNPRISSYAPVGPISKNQIGTGVMSPIYTVFRFHSDANDFFAQYFKSTRWHGYLRRVSNSGARHDRMAVTTNDLMQMPIPNPTLPEQYKVADCLDSLDDLIAAQGQKLFALRQHKQGLIQQLFPQYGETVPRLRFPEFRGAGDWRFQPLSDIAEPISERVGTRKCLPMSVTTGVGLLSQEEKFGRIIAGNSYKDYIRLQTNDFAYNKSATKEFPQGYIARHSGTSDAAVPNSIFTCFRPDAAVVNPEYLDHLFHGNHHGRWLRKYITVGARAHGALSVSEGALMSMPVPLPPVQVSRPEQQKIAECLGPLNDLIAAAGGRVDALRQHKQGLMQQLFPSLEAESR